MTEVTVFLVDDDASVRDAISLLLSLAGMRTQSFAGARSFLDTYRPEWRGCVLTDLRMPVMDGLELQQALQQRGIQLPVVVLTAHGDVQTTRMAMKGGAFDFLEKPVSNDILVDVLTNAIEEDRLRHAAQQHEHGARTRLQRLTPRERDVLALLVKGMSMREIGANLMISPRTVEVYKARIMSKLQCRNIAEIVTMTLGSTN
jgi:FixJ family two-component response regulator